MGYSYDPSKLLVNMEKIREQVAGEGQRRAVLAGARVIAEAMTSRAPVLTYTTPESDSLDPGDMQANMKARTKQVDGETVGLAGPVGKDGKIAKTAYLVEYGHRMVTGGKSVVGADGKFHGGGKVHEKDVQAHPFLRPATEESASPALEAMGKALGEAVAEVKNV